MLQSRSSWSLVLALALVAAMLPGASPVYAADFVVNTTNDLADLNPGDGVCDGTPRAGQQCSLRAAVQTANALGGAHTIVLGGATYNLTNTTTPEIDHFAVTGDLDVHATITVVGRGQEATRIDGQDNDRVFQVHAGGKLILQQLTVQNGQTANTSLGATRGGGVRVESGAALELVQVAVVENESGGAGDGIFSNGSLVIRNSTLRGNFTQASRGDAGGFYEESGTALLENVTITRNSARSGGGCFVEAGQVTMRNVSLVDNTAEGNDIEDAHGGGCFIASGAQLAFVGGRIEQNTAADRGGRLFNQGVVQLTGTTITRNTAGDGGGIFNLSPGTVTFVGAHVNNNTPNNCQGTTSCPP